ncbi:glycosyltransferase WbuB [Enterococcus florum]|uniref:Glycosyltransferase WbuB n=1 Tax=Enterococcus florum TaxID=2480627 RepID=A0A4P5P770_9ENTE|nr:glycosyltransferase family 4 protein [Enterococcus florum]GCF93296.1 glycosyltransferase WbuB [Enterococcus florum]
MSKRLLVVSQYFYPEQFRINDICETWVSKGYDVTVLTGIPNYPKGNFYDGYGIRKKRNENYNGIEIIRIPIIPRKKSGFMMGLNYLSFVFSGILWGLFNKKQFDAVFIYEVSPMTQAIPAIKIAKRLNVPCYIYVMDLWPENFEIITGITSPFMIKPLEKMVDYIYKNCKKIFTASKSFKENIQQRGIPANKVFYWPQYAEEFYRPVDRKSSEIFQDEKKNIIFAGNIGVAQGLDILPEVGKFLKSENLNIRFNIVGDGRSKEKLISEITKEKLNEFFTFLDPVPASDIPYIFSAGDFSFVSLKKSEIFSMTIPAKLQSSMACGMPILLSADGEVQDIIKNSQAGFVSDSGDVKGLLENLKKIDRLSKKEIQEMGRNSKNYYEKNFEKKKLMSIMDDFLLRE